MADWARISRQTIARGLAEGRRDGLSGKALADFVNARYPFGQREMWPYKSWRKAFRELVVPVTIDRDRERILRPEKLQMFGTETRMSLGELARRGELEVGEQVHVDDVQVYRCRGISDRFDGLYVAHRDARFLHSGGEWRSSTLAHGATSDIRENYTGYWDDLPTLVDHLAMALLEVS